MDDYVSSPSDIMEYPLNFPFDVTPLELTSDCFDKYDREAQDAVKAMRDNPMQIAGTALLIGAMAYGGYKLFKKIFD